MQNTASEKENASVKGSAITNTASMKTTDSVKNIASMKKGVLDIKITDLKTNNTIIV